MTAATHRRRDDRPRWHGRALCAAAFAVLTGVVGFFVQVGLDIYAVAEALRTGVVPNEFNTWAAIWPLAAGLSERVD